MISLGILPILPPHCTNFVYIILCHHYKMKNQCRKSPFSKVFYKTAQMQNREERRSWKIKKRSWKSHVQICCQVCGNPKKVSDLCRNVPPAGPDGLRPGVQDADPGVAGPGVLLPPRSAPPGVMDAPYRATCELATQGPPSSMYTSVTRSLSSDDCYQTAVTRPCHQTAVTRRLSPDSCHQIAVTRRLSPDPVIRRLLPDPVIRRLSPDRCHQTAVIRWLLPEAVIRRLLPDRCHQTAVTRPCHQTAVTRSLSSDAPLLIAMFGQRCLCMCFDGQVICADGAVIALKGERGGYKGWNSQLDQWGGYHSNSSKGSWKF